MKKAAEKNPQRKYYSMATPKHKLVIMSYHSEPDQLRQALNLFSRTVLDKRDHNATATN